MSKIIFNLETYDRKKSMNSTQRFRKTKRGLVTNLYSKMKARKSVSISLKQLHQFADCKKFTRLFNEWVKSGYCKQLKPSIDRISNKKDYDIDNIQWLTWSENRYKQSMERRCRKGPVVQLIGTKVVATYSSQREAVMKTGLSQGNISAVMNGTRKTTGGYIFRFSNPDLCQ